MGEGRKYRERRRNEVDFSHDGVNIGGDQDTLKVPPGATSRPPIIHLKIKDKKEKNSMVV